MMFDENTTKAIDEMKERQKSQNTRLADADFQKQLTIQLVNAIKAAVEQILEYSESKPRKVAIESPVTSVSTPDVMKVVPPLKKAIDAVQSTLRGNRPDADQTNKLLGDIHDVLVELPTEHPKQLPFPEKMDVKVLNPPKESKELKNITKAIKAQKIKFDPKVEVKPAPVTVEVKEDKALLKELKLLNKELKKFDITIPEQDTSELEKVMGGVKKAVEAIRIPIPPAPLATVKVTTKSGASISTEDKQDDIISKLQEVADNTDELELKAENVNLNTDTLEAGQASLLTELQKKADNDEVQPVQGQALGTLKTTAVTLTTANTAYKLPSSEQADRRTIVIYNVSDTDVYLGDSSVTTTNGILLKTGEQTSFDIISGLYAVCGTSGKILNVLEMK